MANRQLESKPAPSTQDAAIPPGCGDTLSIQASKVGPVDDRCPARLHELSTDPEEAGRRPHRILVVYERIPCPSQSGADKRLWQVLQALRQLGHSVTLVGLRELAAWSETAELQAMGIEVRASDAEALRFESNQFHAGFTLGQVLRDGHFDVALISVYFWHSVSAAELYMDEIRRLSPRTRIVILTDDCHWLRESRQAKLSGRWSDQERSCSLLQRETEIYGRADLVVSISRDDMQKLEQQFPGIPLAFLPMACQLGPEGPGFAERDGLVYMADYRNPASLDAIQWFLAEAWPLILSRLPDVKLYLIGNGMPAGLGQGVRNVLCSGHVPDLGPEFGKYRVFISPVRWGTGIKTKNLHALAQGLPLVTTSIGAEGIGLRHEESALIADTAQSFAECVVRLYRNQELWRRHAKEGRAHMADVFSEDNLRQRAAEMLTQALRVQPKPYQPDHVFSVRLVDQYFPELISKPVVGQELNMRMTALSRLAEKLLAAGNLDEARRQVQHVFSIANCHAGADRFYASFGPAVERMERIYRGLNEPEGVECMRAEMSGKPHLPAQAQPVHPEAVPAKKRSTSKPVISVVIPTCNRRQTLADCLSALSRQQLPAGQFEVIVIDDGSSDDTEDFCKKLKAPFPFRYFRQLNSGAGAARRLGVEQAQGKYLLLINDDTIAAPDLLACHLAVHDKEQGSKVSVLGNFQYLPAARERALTYYLSVRPFLFPMMYMKAGRYSDPVYFVTCNLNVPRQAVLKAGSFDPGLRAGEDTDLGIRLFQRDFQIVYEPKAQAIHQHLDFKADDLVRRAKVYAPVQFHLIRKHPWMLGEGKSAYGRMDAAAARSLRNIVDKGRHSVPRALDSIRKFDGVNFDHFWSIPSGKKSLAEEIIDLFSVAVPEVYFFYFYQAFLEAWQADGSFPAATVVEEFMTPVLAG